MPKCKWCGEEFTSPKRGSICNHCKYKAVLLPKFVKARDDLREQLGLERMGRDRG